MTSSNRIAAPCDAAVYREDRPIGPIRMPIRKRVSFVEEFNRIYGQAGIRLQPIAPVERPEAKTDNPPLK